MSRHSVSVIIPTFNRAHYVGVAIDSVLAQTHPSVEVIVVDDGSKDNTPDVLAAYGDRIRVITQPNAGSSAARNAAAVVAQGDFLAWLDSDDAWRPEKLSRQVEAADRWPEAVLFHTRCLTMNAEGHLLPSDEDVPTDTDHLESDALERLIDYCYPNTSSCLVRRSVFAGVGGFDAAWVFAEDWELNLRLGECGPFVYLAEPLTCYRSHDQSKTGDKYPHALGQMRIRRHIEAHKSKWLSARDSPELRRSLASNRRQYLDACVHLGRMARTCGDFVVARSAYEQAVRLQPFVFKNWSRWVGASWCAARATEPRSLVAIFV